MVIVELLLVVVLFLMRKINIMGGPYALLFYGSAEGERREVSPKWSSAMNAFLIIWIQLSILFANAAIEDPETETIIAAAVTVLSLPALVIFVRMLCRKRVEQEKEDAKQDMERDKWMRSIALEKVPEPRLVVQSDVQASDQAAPSADAGAAGVDAAFLDRAASMRSAVEIANAFAAQYGGANDGSIAEMRSRLEKIAGIERLYGNNVNAALGILRAFHKHGGRIFPVDRGGDLLTCPNCGKQQKSNRETCFRCGALFSE